MVILKIVVAIYVGMALVMLARLAFAPDTTPIFYRWRTLLMCLAIMVVVSALWPVTFLVEAHLERTDPESP